MEHVFVWRLEDVAGLVMLGLFAVAFLLYGIAVVGDWAKRKIKGIFKRA